MTTAEPGFYLHFKGAVYQVLHTAMHTETGEHVVVYAGVDGGVWVRPVTSFAEEVLVNGRHVPRFRRLTTLPRGIASAG